MGKYEKWTGSEVLEKYDKAYALRINNRVCRTYCKCKVGFDFSDSRFNGSNKRTCSCGKSQESFDINSEYSVLQFVGEPFARYWLDGVEVSESESYNRVKFGQFSVCVSLDTKRGTVAFVEDFRVFIDANQTLGTFSVYSEKTNSYSEFQDTVVNAFVELKTNLPIFNEVQHFFNLISDSRKFDVLQTVSRGVSRFKKLVNEDVEFVKNYSSLIYELLKRYALNSIRVETREELFEDLKIPTILRKYFSDQYFSQVRAENILGRAEAFRMSEFENYPIEVQSVLCYYIECKRFTLVDISTFIDKMPLDRINSQTETIAVCKFIQRFHYHNDVFLLLERCSTQLLAKTGSYSESLNLRTLSKITVGTLISLPVEYFVELASNDILAAIKAI